MKILLIEDEKKLNQTLRFQLEQEGFETDGCYDGEEALYFMKESLYDLVILDRMLPGMDGLSVLQEIRQSGSHVPIILLTALGTISNKIEGLNSGADDYLVKPFDFDELLARIRCLLRRPPQIMPPSTLVFGDFTWYSEENRLTGPTGTCSLSQKEGALLAALLSNPGQVLSRQVILTRVWGLDNDVEEGNLDNYIHFLRRRLKSIGSTVYVHTVRGVGYCLKQSKTPLQATGYQSCNAAGQRDI